MDFLIIYGSGIVAGFFSTAIIARFNPGSNIGIWDAIANGVFWPIFAILLLWSAVSGKGVK